MKNMNDDQEHLELVGVPEEFRNAFCGLMSLPVCLFEAAKVWESEKKCVDRVVAVVGGQLFLCDKKGGISAALGLEGVEEVWKAGREIVIKAKPVDFWLAFGSELPAADLLKKIEHYACPRLQTHSLQNINKHHVAFPRGRVLPHPRPITIRQPALKIDMAPVVPIPPPPPLSTVKRHSIVVSKSSLQDDLEKFSAFEEEEKVPTTKSMAFTAHQEPVFPTASMVRSPPKTARYTPVPVTSSFQPSPRRVYVPTPAAPTVSNLAADIDAARHTLLQHRATHGSSTAWPSNTLHLHEDPDSFWNHSPVG